MFYLYLCYQSQCAVKDYQGPNGLHITNVTYNIMIRKLFHPQSLSTILQCETTHHAFDAVISVRLSL